jgi:methylenetetrahydrofolate dehydrogenase (NADP+)/methenyltetrahydrofolate cyclohydrolase
VVLIGSDPASKIYVSRKRKRALSLGFHQETHRLPETTTQKELLVLVNQLNNDERIHGILVQLPLPKHIEDQAVIEAIAPHKDVDGFHPYNTGLLSQGHAAFIPCTAKGVLVLLQSLNVSLSGMHAVVIGRSNIVGRPVAQLLEQNNCTVTLCHSRTKDLAHHLSSADVVVVAVGIPNFVHGSMLKEGVIVIDVGINRLENRSLCGDVDFASAEPVAHAITPVPGGVGPMTIAILMENTVKSWKKIQS